VHYNVVGTFGNSNGKTSIQFSLARLFVSWKCAGYNTFRLSDPFLVFTWEFGKQILSLSAKKPLFL